MNNPNTRLIRSFALFDNRDFLPRPFQIELYETCKNRDTIVFLRPGQGKYFISVMLVKYFNPHLFPSDNVVDLKNPKKIFFLAKSSNSIKLYSSVFNAHCNLRIGEYIETDDAKQWSPDIWHKKLQSYDIHLMMDCLFEYLIEQKLIHANDLNLLILNDVHKILLCTSPADDCYTKIIHRLRLQTTNEKQYRILGLSASILLENVSSNVFEKMIEQIEKNLCCSCETYADLRMISKYSIQCRIKLRSYYSLLASEKSFIQNDIKYRMALFMIRNYSGQFFNFITNVSMDGGITTEQLINHETIAKMIVDILNVYGILGEWCALKLIDLINRELYDTILLMSKTASNYLRLLNSCHSTLCLIRKSILSYMDQDIVAKYETNTSSSSNGSESQRLTIEQFLLISSPKLHLLAQVLIEYLEELSSPSSTNQQQQQTTHSSFTFPSNICSLIYVENRLMARVLNEWIRELIAIVREINSGKACILDFLQSDYVFLAEDDGKNELKNFYYRKHQKSLHEIYYYRQQEETLRRFRLPQQCNVLITTSMSSEGLDVNRCNMVICFDIPKTFHQFIQSKGRVRVERGQFIVLVEQNDHKDYVEKFLQFCNIEKIFTKLVPLNNQVYIENEPKNIDLITSIQSIKPIHSSSLKSSSIVQKSKKFDKQQQQQQSNQSATLQLTLENAISILNRYCNKLPSDTFTKLVPNYKIESVKEEEENQSEENSEIITKYRCRLFLPINSTYRDEIVGNVQPTQSLAKQSVAFEAIKTLREIVADSLCGQIFSNVDNDEYCFQYLYEFQMKLTYRLSEEHNTRGRRIIDPAETTRTFGIISPNHLPTICDFTIYNRSGEIQKKMVLKSMNIKRQQIENFHQYTFENVLPLGKSSIRFDRMNGSNGNYLIVPINTIDNGDQKTIDWEFLELIWHHKNDPKSYDQEKFHHDDQNRFIFEEKLYQDAVVIPKYRKDKLQSFYYVAEICHDLTPQSPFPDHEYQTFEKYYNQKYEKQITNLEQPLLDVDHTSARLNLLTPRFLNRRGINLSSSSSLKSSGGGHHQSKRNPQQKQILVPELCFIHPFPASFWRKAVCLPCILYRLNLLLIAEELRFKIAKEAKIGVIQLPDGEKWPKLDFGWSVLVEQSRQQTKSIECAGDNNQHSNLDDSNEKQKTTINQDDDFIIDTFDPSMAPPASDQFFNENQNNFINFDSYNNEMIPQIEIISGPFNESKMNYNNSQKQMLSEISMDDDFDEEESGIIEVDNENNPIIQPGQKLPVRAGSPTYWKDRENLESDRNGKIPADFDWRFYESDGNDNESNNEEIDPARAEFRLNFKKFLEDIQQISKMPSLIEQKSLKYYYRHRFSLAEQHSEHLRKRKIFDEMYFDEKNQVMQCVQRIQNETLMNENSKSKNENDHVCCDPEIDTFRNDKNFNEINLNQSLLSVLMEKIDTNLLDMMKIKHEIEDEKIDQQVQNRSQFANILGKNSSSTKIEVKFGELLPNRDENLAEFSSNDKNPIDLFQAQRKLALQTLPQWLQLENSFETQIQMGPHPSLILQAITMSNSSDGINLERLETVGDSFLKYSITAFLFCMCPELNEGKLSFLRSRQISNINLHRLGQRINLGELMIASKFEPVDNWCPPSYQALDNVEQESNDNVKTTTSNKVPYNLLTQHSIPNKSIADCVEALIGTYLISSGSQVEHKDDSNQNHERWLPQPRSPLIIPKHLRNDIAKVKEIEDKLQRNYYKHHLDRFEEIIGYRFRDRAYLVQAFTHNSYYENKVTDCYQRLEFLGDAVLDYLITRYLYEDPRCHSPGTLTDLRSALVNNTFFAALAVKYNFHKYLMMLSSELYRVIDGFVRKFNIYYNQNLANGESKKILSAISDFQQGNEDDERMDENSYSNYNYWELFVSENEAEHLEDIEVPKALGDIFESVAGAIYLDSDMSLEAVWKAYYPMMKPEIENFSEKVPKSPIRVLLEKQPQSVKFGKPEINSGRRIRVTVEVFGLGKFVGIGRNKRIAKCTAAKRALRALESEKRRKELERKRRQMDEFDD
ncbi:Endoribonuclease Dicer [Dermatophagoides pteronyssinus]|uniref:Endoribonuclease Dicer n=1 Tax=Dermatophagoides pteronyssinus TaxID=6956 RepID=A0ABQ8JHS4_DERPT|nr:Endoribonuclease Dicer [Dermatophagoides pteronyssinus]